MPLAIYTSAAFTNTAGVAVAAGASVEVRREDTGALASIFSDVDGLNALANPFNADTNGRFSFYAAGLTLGYKVTVTKDAVSQILRHQAIGTAAQIDLPAIGADGALLTPNAGSALWLSRPFSGAFIINGKITRTVNAGALTIALKTLAGADPSATDPVFVLMPTLTSSAFDGGYAIRKITAALSFVVSSGSTLGHASAVASPVYIYLGDNAGTLVLGASNKFFGGKFVASSTAEGGAGGADSATTLYSTAAQTNIAWVCLQRWKSTQTTAGTWAATTDEVQLYPFPFKAPKVTKVTATSTFTKDWDTLWLEHYVKGGGASGGGSSSVTARGGGGGEGEEGWRVIDQHNHTPLLTVTIGAGGATVAANTNASGNVGGSTSIGSLITAVGGTGGTAGNSGGAGGTGGTGGTGGDYYFKGDPGQPGADVGAGTAIHSAGGGKGAGTSGVPDGVGNTGGGGKGGSNGEQSGLGGSGVAVITEHYSEGA